MANQRRLMPDEFQEHAYESIELLVKRYHAGRSAILRWRNELGIELHGKHPVRQFTFDGEFVAEHPSVRAASRNIYGSECCIRRACSGKSKQAYGFLWRYADAQV